VYVGAQEPGDDAVKGGICCTGIIRIEWKYGIISFKKKKIAEVIEI